MPGIALQISKRIATAAAAALCPYQASQWQRAQWWTNRLRQWWWNDSGIQAKWIWWKFWSMFQWIHMFDRIEFACVRFCFHLAFNVLRYIRCSECACPTGMRDWGEWMNAFQCRERWSSAQESVSVVCKAAPRINTTIVKATQERWLGGRGEGEDADQRVNSCIFSHIRKWPIRKWFYDTVSSFYVTKEKCVNAENRKTEQNNEDIYILGIQRALLERKIVSFLDVFFPPGLSAIDLCRLGNWCPAIRRAN